MPDGVAGCRVGSVLPRGAVKTCALLLAAGSCCLVGLWGEAAGPVEPYVAVLESAGVRPEPDPVREYLRSLAPDDAARARMARLVDQLGDDDFFRREAATRELVRLPSPPTALLERAIAGADPEKRWRARIVLRQADARSSQLLFAAFRVVRERKWEGMTASLLAAVPCCGDEYLKTEAQRALRAAVRPDDAPLLRERLKDPAPEMRAAAVVGLEAALGPEAVADVLPLVEDPADEVRLAAALAAVNHGRRTGLDVLAALLDSPDLRIRTQADRTLRSLTGQQFGFVAYESAENRKESATRWRTWIGEQGPTAALKVPLTDADPLLGRTLVCYYNQNKVVEYDAQGRQTWEVQIPMPYGCDGLPNGHRLVASYTGRMVVEYDAHGKEVWKKDDLPASPFSVRRLSNGHTLVACSDSQRVVEIAQDKSIVWDVRVEGRPMDARRLDNGRTLVALQNGHAVVEVDREGKTVDAIRNLSNPLGVQRLENGHTLVCQMGAGKISEYDPLHKEIWSKTGLSAPHAAQRLPNGHTLIIDSKGAHEYDPRGQEIWTKDGPGAGGICRF